MFMDFCCSVFINGVGQMYSWELLLNFASSVRRIQVNKLLHCVKSAQIRSYFWSVFSCIRTEYRKIRTRNNSVFGHYSSWNRQFSDNFRWCSCCLIFWDSTEISQKDYFLKKFKRTWCHLFAQKISFTIFFKRDLLILTQ